MSRIRVLVVDDAVVVRRIVTEALSEDPGIEVVGVAANGRIALARIAQLNPDLVTLDVEMPEMNGLETVAEIRKQWRRLPVIMFSTLTERGADTTLEALSRGASDYVTKPANVGSVNAARERIRQELLPKVYALCGRRRPASVTPVLPKPSAAPPRHVVRPSIAHAPALRPAIVAIGVSTGGPNALATLVAQLPADLAVPLVVVQHMPPLFTRFLAERLSKLGPIPFREATNGAELLPGTAWIAPGDYHMVVRAAAGPGRAPTVELTQSPPENSCRPAVDPLFRSIAQVFGSRALGVVLTGMGQDGLRGSEALVQAGARVIVQDEATSVVWGMPGFVAEAGLADKVLPIDQVAPELVRRAGIGVVHQAAASRRPQHA